MQANLIVNKELPHFILTDISTSIFIYLSEHLLYHYLVIHVVRILEHGDELFLFQFLVHVQIKDVEHFLGFVISHIFVKLFH